MTRDEAVKIFSEKKIGKDWEIDWIDKLAALGVLKLDEPKSVQSRFREAVSPIGNGDVGPWMDNIWEVIHASGLKIVEN